MSVELLLGDTGTLAFSDVASCQLRCKEGQNHASAAPKCGVNTKSTRRCEDRRKFVAHRKNFCTDSCRVPAKSKGSVTELS
jgi:hypothetical protein